jgi:hypothetical protein
MARLADSGGNSYPLGLDSDATRGLSAGERLAALRKSEGEEIMNSYGLAK